MRHRHLLFIALAALALALPSVAAAHAALVEATPGTGDEVVGSPAEIVATFTQNLDMSRTTMEVRDASGATVAEGPALGDGPRELRLTLPELAPGAYEVRWVTFSAEDSELDRGRYTFTVLAPAPSPTSLPSTSATTGPTVGASPLPPTPAPTPAASAAPAPADDGAALLLPIGVAAILVVAAVAWLLRRR